MIRLVTERFVTVSDEKMAEVVHKYSWHLSKGEAIRYVRGNNSLIALYLRHERLNSISKFVHIKRCDIKNRWRVRLFFNMYYPVMGAVSVLYIERVKKEFYQSARIVVDNILFPPSSQEQQEVSTPSPSDNNNK